MLYVRYKLNNSRLKPSVTPSKIETINTLSDVVHNDMESDYCLCFVDDFSAMASYLKSRPVYLIFSYIISGVLLLVGLIMVTLKFWEDSRPDE